MKLLESHLDRRASVDTAVGFVAPMRPLPALVSVTRRTCACTGRGDPCPRATRDVQALLFELCLVALYYYAESYEATESVARLILEYGPRVLPALTLHGLRAAAAEDPEPSTLAPAVDARA